ncbi:conserved hypothetical protein [Rhodospirillaceae bacterium LM-1]|nr:conserved hypothetical protein [Rhodospirillaceae bacterium LM-1]
MGYPLFDSEFTNWQGDLETRLKEGFGRSIRDLGVEGKTLLDHYYAGVSVFGMLDEITRQHRLSRFG